MLKNLSRERAGEIFIVSQALLASLFPVITKLTLTSMGPLPALAWSMFFVLLFFLAFSFIKNSWVKLLDTEALTSLIGAAAIFGIAFPLLQFIGIKYTSAGNAGIILTLEVFFTFLFFNVWRKDYIKTQYIWGCVLMFISAVVVLLPNFSEFHKGDFIILSALLLTPFGNLLQKRVREKVGSEGILLFRVMLAVPILFLITLLSGEQFVPSG
ncbi:MAG: DMT family transporter, partial [Minisyncoccia bacterium]